jgi:hypothetical protein
MYDGFQRASTNGRSKKTVLKITTVRENDNSLRVHLCGKLTSEYVTELEKALAAGESERSKVAVDMSNVTFVDREAMEFLCGASKRVAIENIPSYVMRWIEQEGRCGSSHSETPEK